MKLKKLIKGLPIQLVKGPKEVEITGICSHSKLVAPGNLFVAKKGQSHDGCKFISDAIASGAVCILSDIYNPFLRDIAQLIHPDIAAIEAELAARFYSVSKKDFILIGITGTSGKTTTAYLVKFLLDELDKLCGLIGSVEWIIGPHYLPSLYTTPDVITCHKLLHEMQQNDCKAAVMEVSSHALEQGRVRKLEFDYAIFTNLSPEHLDYHQTMQNYASAKAKLFSSLSSKKNRAIFNADTPWMERMIKDCPAGHFLFGMTNPKADLRASGISLRLDGMSFQVHYKKESATVNSFLTGRFNVYNCLAVISLGLCLGFPLSTLTEIISRFQRVRGRLEKVPNHAGLTLFVDHAHKPEALENTLQTLSEFKKKRLITVFGCGGDRDTQKRPKMGEIAEKYSDLCIITSDNPRTEDPDKIIAAIVAGLKQPQRALIEPDRRKAIEKAIELANPDDIILIAGKGHETYQIFSHRTIPFDDLKIAQEICNTQKV
jgi:UDP-N-acetylmuramoyl-L-alanyl-D-glutamate--2,6-diaminopimelate ligase